MAKERKRAAKREDSPRSHQLREIAQEASDRLDSVLADGQRARAAPERIAATAPGEHKSQDPTAPPRPKSGRALVSHVCFGVARIIANLLKDMGLTPSVASTLEELESMPGSGDWDIVFLQGTRSPYPCMELVKATLERCVNAETPVVLLNWPGEAIDKAAEDVNVAGALEWPFEPTKVRRELSNLLH